MSPSCGKFTLNEAKTGYNSACVFNMVLTMASCQATFANESVSTTCNAANTCQLGVIGGAQEVATCDGSTWTVSNPAVPSVSVQGSCTCQLSASSSSSPSFLSQASTSQSSTLPSSSSLSTVTTAKASSSTRMRKTEALTALGIAACTLMSMY